MLREAAKISFCRFLILHRKCSWPFSAFSYKKKPFEIQTVFGHLFKCISLYKRQLNHFCRNVFISDLNKNFGTHFKLWFCYISKSDSYILHRAHRS